MIACSPQGKIPNILKALKGVSGRLMLKKYPEIKDSLSGESLWRSNYFVATPSEDIDILIRKYLIHQGMRGYTSWTS